MVSEPGLAIFGPGVVASRDGARRPAEAGPAEGAQCPRSADDPVHPADPLIFGATTTPSQLSLWKPRGRAFCAGGDIRAVRGQVLAGDYEAAEGFFAEEYALNGAICPLLPNPISASSAGICMGGGLGISIHGTHRIVTEAARHGHAGDGDRAGAGCRRQFLPAAAPRLPRHLSRPLRQPAGRAGYRPCRGSAPPVVPAARLPALSAALAVEGPEAIARFAATLPPYALQPDLAAIDRCFGADSVTEIIARLEAEGNGLEPVGAGAILLTMSPSSVCWSLAALRAGAHRDLEACLAAEFALVTQIIRLPDFAEGVRAMVVDKDRMPRWLPARIEDVDPRLITALVPRAS